MSGQIGFAGAFLGGLLTLLSPCAALLLPAFFAVTYDGVAALVSRVGLFFLGLLAAARHAAALSRIPCMTNAWWRSLAHR